MRYKDLIEPEIQNLYHLNYTIKQLGLEENKNKIVEFLKRPNKHSLFITPRKIQVIISEDLEYKLEILSKYKNVLSKSTSLDEAFQLTKIQ